jgi:DNA-binding XRE family transcriptional regulator
MRHKDIVNFKIYKLIFFILHFCGMQSDEFLKRLGQNIARIRESKGLTQSQLALNLDKDRQSLNALEKGRSNATTLYLLDVANALGVSVKDLMDFE